MYQPPYPPGTPPPYPPPAVDPSELRPRRIWYVIAALIAVVLIGAGIAAFVIGIVTATASGSVERRFGSGETATVRLNSQPRSAIYARLPGQNGLNGRNTASPAPTPTAECTVVGPSGRQVALGTPGGTFTLTRNGVAWREIYELPATESGDHRTLCRSSDTDAFAVGDAPDTGKLVGGIAGGLVGLFVLPLTGLLLGVLISVVVAVRRSGHRRRLLAQRYPPQP